MAELITWTEKYSVGTEQIDKEHKKTCAIAQLAAQCNVERRSKQSSWRNYERFDKLYLNAF